MTTTDTLFEIISQIESSFSENELEFLSLTSKIENPMRDKIAYKLHQEFPNKLITREWRSHDLAILDRETQSIDAIIEFKAHSGFKGLDEFKEDMFCDLLKSACTLPDESEGEIIFVFFGMALNATPDGEDANVRESVQYWDGWIRVLNKYSFSLDDQFTRFKDEWRQKLGNTKIFVNKLKCVLAPIMLAKFKEVNNSYPLPHQWS